MKNIFKLFSVAALVSVVLAACTKVPDLPFYDRGKQVTLVASASTLVPTPADSTRSVVSFTWTNPEYKQDTSLYKYVLEIDSTGRNFQKEYTKVVRGVRTTSLTGKELNAVLLGYGFTLGTPYDLDVRVTASYGNNNEAYLSNTIKVKVTPYNDPSVLTSTNSSVTCALATSTSLSNTFNWSSSFNGYTGNVTYTLQFDSTGKNFASLHEIAVGVNTFTKALTQGEMNQTALDEGVAGGTTGKIEYRIKAVTAQGATSYSNTVSVTINSYVPILRLYLPGNYQASTGNGNDWSPETAPELIRDIRSGALNRLYYIYIYLPAGAQFKVTEGRSWSLAYGGTGGILSSSGGNFTVSTAGVYRISIDRVNMQYDIRAGRMGFVGGSTGAGWDPNTTYPAYAMGAPATNLFVGLTTFTTGAWKLIDNNSWDNGSMTVSETRSYASNGGSGSTMNVNSGNMPDIATAGRYRAIWDGRDVNNIKYELYPATEMRVVGDGIQGVNAWDPSTSPTMTYQGNGVWTATLTLIANKDIKFVGGNAWGAFDYEDNSGQSQATGTPRPIKWSGGDNFKTPTTTGSYTITLNENTQTVTIN